MEIGKLKKYIKVAESWALFSKDEETKVGCIIIDPTDGSQISSGYNGFVRGAPDHIIPKTRPDKYKYMRHAETSAICNAARNSGGLKDCIAIITLSPCIDCCRNLFHSGIRTIYFKKKYKDFDESISMLDLNVTLTKIGTYYRVALSPKTILT